MYVITGGSDWGMLKGNGAVAMKALISNGAEPKRKALMGWKTGSERWVRGETSPKMERLERGFGADGAMATFVLVCWEMVVGELARDLSVVVRV